MDGELPLREAAAACGVTWDALRSAVRRGIVPARRLGPIWVVQPAAVGQWRDEGHHKPGPPPQPKPPKRRPGRPRKDRD